MWLVFQGIFQKTVLAFIDSVDYSASAAILETREGQTPSGYPHVSVPFRRSLIGRPYFVGCRSPRAAFTSGDEVGFSLVNSVTIAIRRCRVSRFRPFPNNRMYWQGTMDPSSRLQYSAAIGPPDSAKTAPPDLSLSGLFDKLGYPA
jgi:hypothetical protein